MNGFFGRIMMKLQQFMQGRYGADKFSLFLNIAGLILAVLGNFRPLRFLYFAGLLIILYSSFRALSKNYEKRRRELDWFLRWSYKPMQYFKMLGNRFRDRKTHRYFRCKSCKTVMRVPKGRGKIEITCPKCRMKTIKKT